MDETLDCHGCQLARGEVIPPGGVIWRDHFWHLAHHTNNFIPGFLILGTIPHLTHLYEIPVQEQITGWSLLYQVWKIMAEQISLREFILFQSDYTGSGHYPLWIMPIYPEMQQFGRPPGGILHFLKWSKIHWNIPDKRKEINQISEIVRQRVTQSIS
jgi:diadenosine tetraphosphate (Ap4A) HIT family hydrolase